MTKPGLPNFPHALLHRWYLQFRRTLPWRSNPKPYNVWISEIMLQQTQVITVIPYFEKFIRRFPNFKALAEADESDVLAHWSGLGYYSRARNLHKAAKLVVEQYGGELPNYLEEIKKLPGIGPYTAGAILSIAYNLPFPILDGNVRRVLGRFFLEADQPALWERSAEIIEASHADGLPPSDINQAMMEIGALVCLPANPSCLLCPLEKSCLASKKGLQAAFPPAKKRLETVQKHFSLFVITREGIKTGEPEFWVRKRGADQRWFQGLWEFPMIETGAETVENPAALKKLARKIGASARIDGKLGSITHTVTHHKLNISVYKGGAAGVFPSKNPQETRWLTRPQLAGISSSSILRKALALLR